MRNFTIQIFLFLFFNVISFIALASNEPRSNENSLVSKLNQILSMQEEDKPGFSVLVKKDNEVLFKLSKGLANKEKNLRINTNTGFRIGSMSKPFTALAMMKLVEQKQLSLADPVTKFIVALPIGWKDITIEHLLSHRVYISDDFFSDSNLNLANLSTNRDVITFISSNKIEVKSQAFDKAIYCNSCYVLLAEVVAKVSGVSFSEYLSENIFLPANMKQ